jgi:hypothetical protein
VRNPRGAPQPDLFGGESATFVAVADLSEAELKALPLDAYTNEELCDLDEGVVEFIIKRDKPPRKSFSEDRYACLTADAQELVRDHDPASTKRVADLQTFFLNRYKWVMEPDEDELFREVEDLFEHYLAEDDLIEQARQRGGDYDIDDLIESWTADGYSEDQVETAVREALQDQNNWVLERGSEYGRAFYKLGRGEQSVYAERSEIDEVLDGMFPDEVEAALDGVNRETDLDLSDGETTIDRRGLTRRGHDIRGKYGIDIYVDTNDYVDADPDWDKIEESVKDTLKDREPKGGEAKPLELDEARVVHRYKDGAYVYNLVPEELPGEGKAMGHCVGRPGMGYGRAVHRGEIAVLSLRTESGRPKFTIEAKLTSDKRLAKNKWGIWDIKQIKGKANRLPGWDLGKEGVGAMKEDEVAKLIELMDALGLRPGDVHDLQPALAKLLAEKRVPKRLAGPEGLQAENPRRKSASCGVHGEGCTGFCAPYRP